MKQSTAGPTIQESYPGYPLDYKLPVAYVCNAWLAYSCLCGQCTSAGFTTIVGDECIAECRDGTKPGVVTNECALYTVIY